MSAIPPNLLSALDAVARANVTMRRTYATLKRHASTRYFVYVLLLRDSKVYVGATDNPIQRLTDHWEMTASASKWVRKHGPPQRVMELLQDCAPGDEKYKTLEYMHMFGPANVRGGPYCRVDMSAPPVEFETFRRTRADFQYVGPSQLDELLERVRENRAALDAPDPDES